MNQEIKDRIFAAANELFALSDTGEFPNVEAVRKKSRANMNYVVEALKEWRQQQRQTVQVVREPLPDQLRDTVLSMGSGLWETAQRLANDALDAAKSSFEAEKADMAKLSAEQSEAFESISAELEASQAKRAEAETALAHETGQTSLLRSGNEQLRTQNEKQAARVSEITRRADDLGAELARIHVEIEVERKRAEEERQRGQQDAARLTRECERLRSELETTRKGAASETETLRAELDRGRSELVVTRDKAEADRERLRSETADAREAAATLRGQLEAVNLQNAAFLAALKDRPQTNNGV